MGGIELVKTPKCPDCAGGSFEPSVDLQNTGNVKVTLVCNTCSSIFSSTISIEGFQFSKEE